MLDHEKISNLAPLMDALNALLAENPTGATEGKYAADESLLPEANWKPNILAPLDYFWQIDKGIGFNQAVTNGRIQSEMATKTVNDFKDFLESISFVDPDTLSSPEKEWCEHNKKAIEAMREELNK